MKDGGRSKTRVRQARSSWSDQLTEMLDGASPSLVVTCARSRLLVVGAGRPAVVACTHSTTVWPSYRIDVQGVYVATQHGDDYVLTPLWLRCRRHGGHDVDCGRLLHAWQGVDPVRKTPRVIDVQTLAAPGLTAEIKHTTESPMPPGPPETP